MTAIAEMTFSTSAKNQLKKLIAASDKKNTILRITVSGGGCSGFQYHFDFGKDINDDDLAINSGDETLGAIDETSYELLKGSQIDYVDDLGGSFFKINNPNSTATCGCGTSFSV